jgi:hypothetical protein
MKRVLLLLAACVMVASPASAMPRHRIGGLRYLQPLPFNVNAFGPNRSGIAPSTAVPERGQPVYAVPATGGAHTGGVKD